jgi:hypothetical protein
MLCRYPSSVNEARFTQGGSVVDLPDADDLAVAHGEVLGDAEVGSITRNYKYLLVKVNACIMSQ